MKKVNYSLIFLLFFFLFLSGCSKKEENKQSAGNKDNTASNLTSKGKEIFYTPSAENNMKCADCHSDGTNTNNILTNYFSDIRGADKRVSVYAGKFKGPEVKDNASGATICWQKYLLKKTLMTDEEIYSLNAYYASVSSGSEPTEIKINNIAIPEPDKNKLKEEQSKIVSLKGDDKRGEELFNKSCSACHGENSQIKKVPNLFKDFDGDAKSVTYMVRFGKKSMPFFGSDKFSTQDIADITAFIIKKNKK